jgi:hypothetical protein
MEVEFFTKEDEDIIEYRRYFRKSEYPFTVKSYDNIQMKSQYQLSL